MAILSKIRDRSMFLILIVGLALFAFVLDPSSIQSFFSSSKINSIGEVNGEEIDREAFIQQVEAYRSQSGGRSSQIQAVNAVWNAMIADKIFETQLEDAGIVIGEKDIWDAMVQLPQIQNSALFKNEANLFDEEKLKEYIANMQDDAEAGDNSAWLNWIATEKSIKQNIGRQAYTSLVSAGLGATLAEGERSYIYQNTKIDARYVYIPYTTIPDSLSIVSKDEIQKYLDDNQRRFKAEATRTLQYVRFDINPSEADEEAIKSVVGSFINDREEYSNAAKTTVNIAGLKNASDYEAFLSDNKSDLSIDNGYKYKNQLGEEVSEEIFNASVGDVVGPYKDYKYYKISKVVEIAQLPDSVKSSHIIIPFAGATRSTTLVTKEAAKKTVDSIYALVRNNKTKFTEIADEINSDGTKGKGGDIGWVRKDQAFSQSFDKDFADFIYKKKVGSINVVETAFGYHVIRIDEQKTAEKAVRLATYARLIEASEETENDIFEQAETFASKLAEEDANLDEIAVAENLKVQSALNLKALEENIPGLNSQRQIVTWAFREAALGDSKRFDIDVNGQRGYAVVLLKSKTEEDGVVVSSDLLAKVRPELINKKKAAQIKEKMNGATLEEIAKNSDVRIRSASQVTQMSPLLSGVGNEPAIVGAMAALKLDELSEKIEGEKGVFVITVTKREKPVQLENYNTFRNTIDVKIKGKSFLLFQVLEETADIKDNRSNFF